MGQAEPGKIPILYSSDLHHPHCDPDDHFDLATLFAIPEFDIRGVILDCGERQLREPGEIPLRQMMHLTGRKVPYAIGLGEPLKSVNDDGCEQAAEYQKGVALMLDVLAKSPEKVVIFTTGSVRDTAAAFNRRPDLFRQKVKGLFLNIGDASVRDDYNIDLDVQAWVCLMRSGLPIYYCVCDDGGPYQRGHGYATFWRCGQRAVLETAPRGLQNFYLFCRMAPKDVDPIAFLSQPQDPAVLGAHWDHEGDWERTKGIRDMWCTAPLLHAAGRRIVETAPAEWTAMPATIPLAAGQKEVKPYDFVPVRIAVDDQGATRLDFTGKEAGKDMLIFKVLEMNDYDKIMESCLKKLFAGIPMAEK